MPDDSTSESADWWMKALVSKPEGQNYPLNMDKEKERMLEDNS